MRVIKLGGSLLDFDGLVPALRRWYAAQPAMPSAMIVGGGDMADAVRAAFARHRLDEESAHWLCIRILGVTAELVARLLPEARFVRCLEELQRLSSAELALFDCQRYLRDEASILQTRSPGLAPLPHSWDVTSDSIAARLAVVLGASELVLLKSAAPERFQTLQQAADAGYVDRFFPHAAAGIPCVRAINLRSPDRVFSF